MRDLDLAAVPAGPRPAETTRLVAGSDDQASPARPYIEARMEAREVQDRVITGRRNKEAMRPLTGIIMPLSTGAWVAPRSQR